MSGAPAVSVLTAATGLGLYVPSLLIQRRLAAHGVRADVEVLEGHYTPAGLERQRAYQQACRDRFELALMAHRMARGVDDCLDGVRLDALLKHWAAAGRRHFIVWSGYWLPILERYRASVGEPLHVDCCRIDAELPASFRVHAGLVPDATAIWLWSWAEKQTRFEIAVGDDPPLPFEEREQRLVVHGGGWGIGTYRARRAELLATPWACDLVVHDAAEASGARAQDRVLTLDPGWRPWHRRDGALMFPPLGGLDRDERRDAHALFDVVRRARAIVSKPGGGTLVDSLAAATPVVLLEPYGDAEAANGALWQHLGFGVPWDEWRDSGYDPSLLLRLQENLMRRRRGPDYVSAYVERLVRGAAA